MVNRFYLANVRFQMPDSRFKNKQILLNRRPDKLENQDLRIQAFLTRRRRGAKARGKAKLLILFFCVSVSPRLCVKFFRFA